MTDKPTYEEDTYGKLKRERRNLKISNFILAFFFLIALWVAINRDNVVRECRIDLEVATRLLSISPVESYIPDILPSEEVVEYSILDKYIAMNEKDANAVADELIPDGGKANNICGPLSISILKDMGYVDEDVPLKDFWYLRPWEESIQNNILIPAFPESEWIWDDNLPFTRITTSVNNYDFDQFPLQEGDMLFLPYNYQCGGTFAHIFVVTRVENRIPYTITNFQTTKGWKIDEIPIYGPDDSLFALLTDKTHESTIGTTGFCGFYLWRKK